MNKNKYCEALGFVNGVLNNYKIVRYEICKQMSINQDQEELA